MKVVADENIPLVREAFADFGTVVTTHGRQISKELLHDASILLVRSITKVNGDLLDGSSVRFVASATIGIDHVDTDCLRENSIGFAYAPGCNSDSVAEYVVAAVLHMAKTLGRTPQSLVLGVIGVGNVGSSVCRRAGAMGIRYVLNDPPKQRMTGSDIFVPLEAVLEQSDMVTVHVPLVMSGDDATYHMVGHEFLARMKRGAVLINSSRGKVVDEKVLRADRGRLGGLVLDVWEGEPSISVDTVKMANIATPHIAGYSYDGKVRGTQMIYDAACAFFFRENKWRPGPEFFNESAGTIDVTSSEDPVADAVRKAYSIEDDDKRLRKIEQKDRARQGEYFDELRKTYPKRSEFPHFTVKCSRKQKEADVLKGLGFRVSLVG